LTDSFHPLGCATPDIPGPSVVNDAEYQRKSGRYHPFRPQDPTLFFSEDSAHLVSG